MVTPEAVLLGGRPGRRRRPGVSNVPAIEAIMFDYPGN